MAISFAVVVVVAVDLFVELPSFGKNGAVAEAFVTDSVVKAAAVVVLKLLEVISEIFVAVPVGEDTTVVAVPGALRYLDVELAAMSVKSRFIAEA